MLQGLSAYNNAASLGPMAVAARKCSGLLHLDATLKGAPVQEIEASGARGMCLLTRVGTGTGGESSPLRLGLVGIILRATKSVRRR